VSVVRLRRRDRAVRDLVRMASAGRDGPSGIDKSVLAVAAPRRYRNREHLRHVAQQACLVCGRKPSDPPTSDSRSPVRSAARSAMSLRSPSVEGIIVPCIAHATSARGGGRPASTRSRLPAGSGSRRAERDSDRLQDRQYVGRVALPHPLTPRTTKSAPPRRWKRKLAYRIFPASRAGAAGCSRITSPQPRHLRNSPRTGVESPPFLSSPTPRRRCRRKSLTDQQKPSDECSETRVSWIDTSVALLYGETKRSPIFTAVKSNNNL
jgi:hypothetical protein